MMLAVIEGQVEILSPIDVTEAFPLERANPMFHADEVALWLRCSTRDLSEMRLRGDGPPFIRMKKNAVRYLLSDLLAWVARNRAGAGAPLGRRPHYRTAPKIA